MVNGGSTKKGKKDATNNKKGNKRTAVHPPISQPKSPRLSANGGSDPSAAAPNDAAVQHQKTDVRHPDGYMNLTILKPLYPLASSFHKHAFYVNELLCYIQNKMDTVPFDALAKLTHDLYASDEIKQAKVLLFQLVSRPGHRFSQCIGPNKSLEDVQNMLKLLLSSKLSEVPIFLVLDITRLLPMPSDCQDIFILCIVS